MDLYVVTKLIYAILNVFYKIANFLGITAFNEKITDIMAELA